jgi:hypothetical protein
MGYKCPRLPRCFWYWLLDRLRRVRARAIIRHFGKSWFRLRNRLCSSPQRFRAPESPLGDKWLVYRIGSDGVSGLLAWSRSASSVAGN